MVNEINSTELWKITWKKISRVPFLWGSFSLHILHISLGTLDRFHHGPKNKKRRVIFKWGKHLILGQLPMVWFLHICTCIIVIYTSDVYAQMSSHDSLSESGTLSTRSLSLKKKRKSSEITFARNKSDAESKDEYILPVPFPACHPLSFSVFLSVSPAVIENNNVIKTQKTLQYSINCMSKLLLQFHLLTVLIDESQWLLFTSCSIFASHSHILNSSSQAEKG